MGKLSGGDDKPTCPPPAPAPGNTGTGSGSGTGSGTDYDDINNWWLLHTFSVYNSSTLKFLINAVALKKAYSHF